MWGGQWHWVLLAPSFLASGFHMAACCARAPPAYIRTLGVDPSQYFVLYPARVGHAAQLPNSAGVWATHLSRPASRRACSLVNMANFGMALLPCTPALSGTGSRRPHNVHTAHYAGSTMLIVLVPARAWS